MTGRGRDARGYFARQLRREREQAGWTLTELGKRSGINAAHLGRIESGDRPPTGKVADGLDRAWPDRHRFWRALYDDSQGWREIPSGFRSWAEHESETGTIRIWQSGLVDGAFQTPDYAAAVLATETALDDATRSERLIVRMQRSQRIIDRLRGAAGTRPLLATILVDEVALIRDVGGPEVMAAQLSHLAGIAALPAVTLMIVPVRAHQAMASGCIVTDTAVWTEHLVTGGVYVDDETVRAMSMRFASLTAESYRASESIAMIKEAATSWQATGRGASPVTAPGKADSALR